MVHGLVHAAAVGDEPVVDAAERGQHVALYPGLLGDLADRGLFRGLAEFDVALRQRPQHPAATVDATDQRGDLLFTRPVDTVDDQSAGRRLMHGAQPIGRRRPRARPAGLRRRLAVPPFDGLVARLVPAPTGRAPTTAPTPAPSWFALFAVRHPSDSSWRDSFTPAPRAGGGCAGRISGVAGRPIARLRSRTCLKPLPTPNCWPPPGRVEPARRRRCATSARCSPTPATTCTWWAAASATRCWAAWVLTWTSPPTPVRSRYSRSCDRGPTRCGTPVSSSAPSARQRATTALEITTYRADRYDRVSRNPRGAFRRARSTTICCAATSPPTRWRCASPRTGPANSSIPLGGLAATPRRRAGHAGDAVEVSFGDDPLRMLRAARFVSQLGFTIAPRVRSAIEEMAPELGRITAERVAAELDKLLLGDDPVAGIDLMVDTAMGDVVLPEVGAHATGHRRAPPAQGRLPAFADRAAPGDRSRGRGSRPGAAVGGAAARHRQARHPQARARRRGQLPPPRGRRGEDGCASGCGR